MTSSSETAPATSGGILIVGGYGQVGLSIAEALAPAYPGRVTIAGRNADKARAAAAGLGHGAGGRELDISAQGAEAALEGIALVVLCLDQTDTGFVEACLSRGIHYVDISADHGFLSRVEALDGLARQNGATALLSVGVAPGLTNLLAARAHDRMARLDRIDILLEFGTGDEHGRAAVDWMFDNLDADYEVIEDGRMRGVRSFAERLDLRLPGQARPRPAYRFNFSDQHVIGRTLGVKSVSTWVRFEDRLTTWVFAAGSRAGLGRLLARPFWRRLGLWLFLNMHLGSDRCGVAVRARGRTADGGDELTLGVVGRKEALMTAVIAAEAARQVLETGPGPGVFHSEQVIALDPVIAALKASDPGLVVKL